MEIGLHDRVNHIVTVKVGQSVALNRSNKMVIATSDHAR
jgi:hypothetical protein